MPTTTAPRFFSRLLNPWLLASIVIQLVLVLYGFRTLIFHPTQYLIVTHFDGIKSYFSIASFLRQPLSDGMLVRGHNYPFGEFMYYTDSTPLVAELLHVLVRVFPILEPYGLYIYDLFVLGGLMLSTALLDSILRRLDVVPWLTLLLAVGLPWLGPQTPRLYVGHMSLSYTPAILLALWVLLRLYTNWTQGRPVRRWFVGLGLTIFITSYLHFYYLGITGVFAGFFFLIWVLAEAREGRPWQQLATYGVTTLLFALTITWGLLMVLDAWYFLRPTGSSGYDWIEWKFQFGAFFRGYDFNKTRFLFERTAPVPYESSAYLGAFVLFGLLAVGTMAIFKRAPRLAWRQGSGRFLALLVLASLPVLSIALGEIYELDNSAYYIHNYLNPFFFLHKLTNKVTQFRALGRFVWPFWWALVLGFSWYASQWWQRPKLRWLLAILSLFFIKDVRDAVHGYGKLTQRFNLLQPIPKESAPMQMLLGQIDPQRYQAILPLPYYHSGTEGDGTYTLTIDPDDPHCNNTYQLSMLSRLPLMSHKATRTANYQAELLYTIFRPEGMAPELRAKLDQRPILVYLDSAYYDGRNNYYPETLQNRPTMLTVFDQSRSFIQDHHLRLLRHHDGRSLYEWYPNAPIYPTTQPAQ
ncbi:hypothetical protein [Hymenobacter defluvii]|uniref:DUF6311 domain-containing protein n=1 Tax=Hymenobacter defluvii TaxID=2054411 RepID=A0ABS3THV1_9BACT|nr:hypothetical protein [Hymenobacter defluvii]MBO3273246.1 hypothetical protein [Hymenobacter defluvii]